MTYTTKPTTLSPSDSTNHTSSSNALSPDLVPIVPAKISTTRTLCALQGLNHNAASADRGASINEINQIADANDLPDGEIPKDNFVYNIIDTNRAEFNKMLENHFCKAMAAAQTEAEVEKVKKGYKWYMVQDFKYCEGLMRFDAARAAQAPTTAEVLDGAQHVSKSYDYAQNTVLKGCEALGIPKEKVFAAETVPAAKNYTNFEVKTAEAQAWQISEIAMIPCIQGYYQISKQMEKDSKRKDTPWYSGWVEQNVDWSYCKTQIAFFEANMQDWQNATFDVKDSWNEVFKTACLHEIDFFHIGENPKDI